MRNLRKMYDIIINPDDYKCFYESINAWVGIAKVRKSIGYEMGPLWVERESMSFGGFSLPRHLNMMSRKPEDWKPLTQEEINKVWSKMRYIKS